MDQPQNTNSATPAQPASAAPAPASAAAQLSLPVVQAAPAPAPASAPAAPEMPKAAPADVASKADVAALKLQLAEMSKRAQDADTFKSKLAEVFGLGGQKVDPLEAATKQLGDKDARINALEQRVKQAALVDALRQHAGDAHDAKDLVGFLPAEALGVDVDGGKLANEDSFKAAIEQIRSGKPYLFKQAQQAAPSQPAPSFAPPAQNGTAAAAPQKKLNGGFGFLGSKVV